MILSKIISKVAVIILLPSICMGAMLHDWNEQGNTGHTWVGNTWQTDADGYGSQGWWDDDGYNTGTRGWMPRYHEKADYAGSETDAECSTDIPPSTTTGRSLHCFEGPGATNHGTFWWFIYQNNFMDLGYSTADTNRMSFYYKVTGLDDPGLETDPANYNIHIGTYLCDGTTCVEDGGNGEGECTNYDGIGTRDNCKYYHHLTINNGAWIHVNLDATPQHLREATGSVDPTEEIPDYYKQLATYYIETDTGQANEVNQWIDEIYLNYDSEPQNETSIASMWVGYWSTGDYWEIAWQDQSFTEYNNDSASKFEIRWSLSPITNANYSSATVVEPEFHEVGTTNYVRRPNSWKRPGWTRFYLPTVDETSVDAVYFAMVDKSLISDGDGHDAPSSLIKRIDFQFASTTGPTRSAVGPSGEQPQGTSSVTLTVHTEESAECRYGADGVTGIAYSSLTGTMTDSSNTHTATISGLVDGGSYSRAIRCALDDTGSGDGEANDTDVVASWTVASGSGGGSPGISIQGGITISSGVIIQ